MFHLLPTGFKIYILSLGFLVTSALYHFPADPDPTTRPDKHGRVFLEPCNTWLSVHVYTGQWTMTCHFIKVLETHGQVKLVTLYLHKVFLLHFLKTHINSLLIDEILQG